MNIVEPLSFFISAVLLICTVTILFSVALSFTEDRTNHQVKQEKKSIVETGTMIIFFLLYYASIKTSIGSMTIVSGWVQVIISCLCLGVIVFGTYVNVRGRWELGQNWANQIKIYKDHQLKVVGMFSLVRHPLYASLIWIFVAGSILFSNWVAFLLTIGIFIPFMYYRAKQEESLLLKEFPEAYTQYQSKVAMFLPRIPR